uniref:ANK_REP_REGION domain-containing protein n=1 Tax=Macrostomum lignano TaxID=282301 RepID=A0A1I8JJC9_9PLAT
MSQLDKLPRQSKAAYDGDLQELKKYIRTHGILDEREQFDVNISVQDKNQEFNALMYCCDNRSEDRAKDIVLARWLINADIDLGKRDKNRRTALHIAIENNAVEIAKMIIESDKCKLTLKSTIITELLLERMKEGIDKVSTDGETAFTMAGRCGGVRHLKLLKEANADIEHRNRAGMTALDIARLRGRQDIVRYLEKLYKDKRSQSQIVRQLTDLRSDPSLLGNLYKLIQNNCRDQFKKLLGTVYNVDSFGDEQQCSLLMTAARFNRVRMIQDLFDARAHVDLRDTNGMTALHHAVEANSQDSVLKLLQCGADPNCMEDENGHTPLMLCSIRRRCRKQIVTHLLKHRSNVFLECNSGNSAAHLAVHFQNAQFLQLLLEERGGCLSRADKPNYLEDTDANGNTAFTLAAEKGHLDMVQLLAKVGANFNHKNRFNQRAIDLAVENGHHLVVDFIKKLMRTWRYPAMITGASYRGIVVFISIWSDEAHRVAIEYDQNRLLSLFQTTLRYKFRLISNPTAKELQSKMQDIGKEDHSSKASFICIVSAHGRSDMDTRRTYISGRNPTNPATESAGKKLISVENLIDPITSCPSLRGKPKVFFTQACRCLQKDLRAQAIKTPPRGARQTNQRDLSDLLEVYSTSQGDASFRHQRGTVFIENLCRFISDYRRRLHLKEIVDKLAAHMADTPIVEKPDGTKMYQTIETRGSLAKQMYFHDDEIQKRRTA